MPIRTTPIYGGAMLRSAGSPTTNGQLAADARNRRLAQQQKQFEQTQALREQRLGLSKRREENAEDLGWAKFEQDERKFQQETQDKQEDQAAVRDRLKLDQEKQALERELKRLEILKEQDQIQTTRRQVKAITSAKLAVGKLDPMDFNFEQRLTETLAQFPDAQTDSKNGYHQVLLDQVSHLRKIHEKSMELAFDAAKKFGINPVQDQYIDQKTGRFNLSKIYEDGYAAEQARKTKDREEQVAMNTKLAENKIAMKPEKSQGGIKSVADLAKQIKAELGQDISLEQLFSTKGAAALGGVDKKGNFVPADDYKGLVWNSENPQTHFGFTTTDKITGQQITKPIDAGTVRRLQKKYGEIYNGLNPTGVPATTAATQPPPAEESSNVPASDSSEFNPPPIEEEEKKPKTADDFTFIIK